MSSEAERLATTRIIIDALADAVQKPLQETNGDAMPLVLSAMTSVFVSLGNLGNIPLEVLIEAITTTYNNRLDEETTH
jgi:hypothetical protein